jgi:microcystin-dependent protein
LQGNAGTSSAINYIGTLDAQDLVLKTNNLEAIRINTTTNNVGINNPTPAPAAKLDVVSTTAGFAMPRMTTLQRYAIAIPIDGLQVYDTNLKDFYYYNGTKWDCVSVRAGTVTYFANAVAPTGYLACDGASYSATTYPELAAAIQYLYGGVGLNFNVPDLRGEFIRGVSTGRVGVDAGRVIGTGQAASTHRTVQGPGSTGAINSFWADAIASVVSDASTAFVPLGPQGSSSASGYTTGSVTIQEFQHRPRNVAMLPCIKY